MSPKLPNMGKKYAAKSKKLPNVCLLNVYQNCRTKALPSIQFCLKYSTLGIKKLLEQYRKP